MIDYRNRLTQIIALLSLLVAAWLLWSGIYKPILLWLGGFSCLLTLYIAYRIGFFKQASGIHLIPRLPVYWMSLIKEIVKSSFDVAKIILSPSLPISPTVVEIEAKPTGPIGQAILGNAITLSPGTVTLDVHDGQLLVHCLTHQGAEELIAGDSNRRAAALTSR